MLIDFIIIHSIAPYKKYYLAIIKKLVFSRLDVKHLMIFLDKDFLFCYNSNCSKELKNIKERGNQHE